MKIKDIRTTFTDYKKTGLLVAFPTCTFKCCKEGGFPIETCQNCEIASQPDIEISADEILSYYNPEIHKCLVVGGLEPLDSWVDLKHLLLRFRLNYEEDVIIYTGYDKPEIEESRLWWLSDEIDNVYIKVGRYVPDQKPHFDEVLGVNLASDNQYAIRL